MHYCFPGLSAYPRLGMSSGGKQASSLALLAALLVFCNTGKATSLALLAALLVFCNTGKATSLALLAALLALCNTAHMALTTSTNTATCSR